MGWMSSGEVATRPGGVFEGVEGRGIKCLLFWFCFWRWVYPRLLSTIDTVFGSMYIFVAVQR